MNILNTATEWAKDELVSTPFFVIFGILFMLASLGFSQLGKTEMARAYIYPMLIAGALLTIIGLGLFFTNKSRIKQFETQYNENVTSFVNSEIERAESMLKEYNNVVFKGIPIIIIIATLVLLFINTPIWRASMITTIGMLVVILLIDGTAHARIDAYHKQLVSVQKEATT